MDKYIELFCEYNPELELECGNKNCKHVFKVKSEEFFKDNIYNYRCVKCSKISEYNAIALLEEFKKEVENLE